MVNFLNKPIVIERDLVADAYFQEALTAFDKNNLAKSAMNISEGAQALLKESPIDSHSIVRKLVEQRVGELFNLSLRVESYMVHDREILQNAFADADESLAHRYYESTNTLISGTPDDFADRLMGLSVHLRNSKNYRKPTKKGAVGKAADDAANLAADIRKMKSGERNLSPALKTRLNNLMAEVKALKLDE